MKDWIIHFKKFLNLSDQKILQHSGKISHEMAIAKANEEYKKYRIQQNNEYIFDFDRQFVKYLKGDN